MRNVHNPKIFGIGLNKTGTTTLSQCGRILGYRCTSCSRSLLEDWVLRNDLSRIRAVVNQFDLFEDWPWPLIYQELDLMFPGSKFILTTRRNESLWLASLKKHSMRTHPTQHCRQLAYGYSFPHRHEKEHWSSTDGTMTTGAHTSRGETTTSLSCAGEKAMVLKNCARSWEVMFPTCPCRTPTRGENCPVDKAWFLKNKVLSLFS